MKRWIYVSILSCLIVVSLVLASCGKTPEETTTKTTTAATTTKTTVATTTTKTTVATTTAAADQPQYGGAFKFPMIAEGGGQERFDISTPVSDIVNLMYEGLLYYDVTVPASVWSSETRAGPDNVRVGWLAESWQLPDTQTVTFKLRQGVKFFSGREMVATDVKWSWEWYQASPTASKDPRQALIDSITCPDKYTITFHFNKPMTDEVLQVFHGASNSCGMVANPDVINTKGANGYTDWANADGTGPFRLTNFTPGSVMTFTRNANYYLQDKRFPGKQLPYFDRIDVLTMADQSTQQAAMRTGKIDYLSGISWIQRESVSGTNPEILYQKMLGMPGLVAMQCQKSPWKDVRVRQAMAMGIDQQAIIDDFYKGNAEIACITWPIHKSMGAQAVKYEELPQMVKDMFGYNPEKGKALLREAGVPDNFSTTLIIKQIGVDVATILKDQLKKSLNVNVEIIVAEAAQFSAAVYQRQYDGMVMRTPGEFSWQGAAYSTMASYFLPESFDYAAYDSAEYRAKLMAANGEFDAAKRMQMYKEVAMFNLQEGPYLLPPAPYVFNMWQPWIGGYRGQYGQLFEDYNMFKWFWLKADVKKAAGK